MTDESMKGTISVRQVKSGLQACIDVPTKKGSQTMVVNDSKLSSELAATFKQSPKSLDGTAVEYVMDKGQVHRVWQTGKTWDRGEQTAPLRSSTGTVSGRGGHQPRSQNRGGPTRGQGGNGNANGPGSRNTGPAGKFENPYNFIPVHPRQASHGELWDSEPSGHHRYHPTRWSGRIRIELTTKTPLLIPDFDHEQENGHKIFGLRLDAKGIPILPPTTIKGPLRVAYEAITNSRMGIFVDHDEPLGLRYPAQSGAGVIPVRVSDDGEQLEVLNGTTSLSPSGKPTQGQPQCAAWLPYYATRRYLKSGANLARHGAKVWARIQHRQHYRKRYNDRIQRDEWNPDFRFWRVLELAPDGPSEPADGHGVAPEQPRPEPTRPQDRTYSSPTDINTLWVRGWVMINGLNITRKHDERVFFEPPNEAVLETVPLTPELRAAWGTLIASYREANDRELRRGHHAPSALPQNQNYEFSRHIRDSSARSKDNRLNPGTLCYAILEGDRDSRRVLGLYPVMISRDLYASAPDTLLSENAVPATDIKQLSPADHVFGWVNQKGAGSFKGQLRIGAVTCIDGPDAVEQLGENQGLPLAILGQPKPAQARFYAAANDCGDPLPAGVEKKDGYRIGRGLRGRKVYPHQQQAELSGYWTPVDDVTNELPARLNGKPVYREWQSQANARSDQNRSMTAWIKQHTRFAFDIDVVNLSDVELGALLWMLEELAEGHLRIGGGKPLGFGSANLRVTDLNLCDGDGLAADYRAFKTTLEGRRIMSAIDANEVINAYKTALSSALGQSDSFDQLSVIKAFRNAAKGSKLPTHYPRTDQQRGPVGESYKWFVRNEDDKNDRRERHSLPSLAEEDRGLPTLIEN